MMWGHIAQWATKGLFNGALNEIVFAFTKHIFSCTEGTEE